MTDYNLTRSLGYQTGLAGRLFNRLLTKRFRDAGIDISAEQWGVIQALHHNGAMTQSQISEKLYLEKSTVSRSISGLEKRGWVSWRRGTEDARQKLITLTPNAREVTSECTGIAKGVLEDAQAGLSPNAVDTTLEQLSGVIHNLRELD